MINPVKLLELQNVKKQFDQNHPRFQQFLQAAAAEGLCEGSIIEIKVVTPEGKQMCTNLKIQPSDLELMETIKDLVRK